MAKVARTTVAVTPRRCRGALFGPGSAARDEPMSWWSWRSSAPSASPAGKNDGRPAGPTVNDPSQKDNDGYLLTRISRALGERDRADGRTLRPDRGRARISGDRSGQRRGAAGRRAA